MEETFNIIILAIFVISFIIASIGIGSSKGTAFEMYWKIQKEKK